MILGYPGTDLRFISRRVCAHKKKKKKINRKMQKLRNSFRNSFSKNSVKPKENGGGLSEGPFRVLTSIDVEKKEAHCSSLAASRDIYAVSHRWTPRDGAETYKVFCGDESYTCLLMREEVENIKLMLGTYPLLWIDSICINQNSTNDKNEQCGMMGLLYLEATSLLLGHHFRNECPGVDYLERAW